MLIISNIHYILEISVLLLRSLLLLMLHYNDHQHDEVVKYAAPKHHHPSALRLRTRAAHIFSPQSNQQHRQRLLYCVRESTAQHTRSMYYI